MDEGYSAGERKAQLKSILTRLEQEHSHTPCAETESLICTVKEIIDREQDGKPVIDDAL